MGTGFGVDQCLLEAGATGYIPGRRREVLDAAVEKLGKGAVGIHADASVKDGHAAPMHYDRNLLAG